MEISYENGRLVAEKLDMDWEKIMKETKGVWTNHPIFKEMKDAIEIVNWMRGKL